MAKLSFKIESIDGGIASTYYNAGGNQYDSAIGIDPDMPQSITDTRTSGAIIPSIYSAVSSTGLTDDPVWIVTNPKTSFFFVLAEDGKLHSYSESNGTISTRATDEAGTNFPISVSGSVGNGMAYYNNFIYIFEAADVSQYGGMDQGASIAKTENVWTGAKFSKTALNNFVYPSIRGVSIPNHPAHQHVDGALYFGDTLNGAGIIHKIKTRKVTIEGDTDDGSGYNVLDLPLGYYPTDIESYGNDLVIAAVQIPTAVSNPTINQGRAALFFWDTISDSFYNQVYLPDPLCTALLNKNGQIFVFTGNAQSGARVSRYTGGQSVEQISYLDEGISPFAGAVDAFGDRVSFGGYTTYPETSASVFSIGSKTGKNAKSLHNTVRTNASTSTPVVSCLKYVQQANNSAPRMIVGWRDATPARGLDYYNTASTTSNSVFRTRVFSIGKKFTIEKIQIPLTFVVSASTSIIPKVLVDGGASSFTLSTVNSTNFASKKNIIFKNPKASGAEVRGEHDFQLELKWSSSDYNGVTFPIEIIAQVYDDEPVS